VTTLYGFKLDNSASYNVVSGSSDLATGALYYIAAGAASNLVLGTDASSGGGGTNLNATSVIWPGAGSGFSVSKVKPSVGDLNLDAASGLINVLGSLVPTLNITFNPANADTAAAENVLLHNPVYSGSGRTVTSKISMVRPGTSAGNYSGYLSFFTRLSGSSIVEAMRITEEYALAIKDGITAPTTLAGFAQIYVDTSDGDLKVKFGDGTIKTIVVDT